MIRAPRRPVLRPDQRRPSPKLVPIVGIAGAVFFLAIIGSFMAIPLLNTRNPPSAFTYRIGDWRVDANVEVAPDGTYEVVLRFFDPSGEPSAPAALAMEVGMVGHPMPPAEVPLSPLGEGTFRALGTLPMTGRWRFVVEAEQEQFELVVNRAEES